MQLWPGSIKLIHVGTQHPTTNLFPSALSCVLVHSLHGELAVMVVSVSPARLSQGRVLSGGICFRGSSVIGSDNGERCCRIFQFFFSPTSEEKSGMCEIKKKRPRAKANIRACHPCVSAEIDATCSDFDFGTALHIAASNLCLSAVKCLLELRANPAFRVSRLPSRPQISDPAPFYPKHARTLLTQARFFFFPFTGNISKVSLDFATLTFFHPGLWWSGFAWLN